MAHVSEAKKATVEELKKTMGSYNVIGIVRIDSLPALQFNRMRKLLRGSVVITVCKKRLIKIALEQSGKKGAEKLNEYLDGMIGLVATNDNPFKLAKVLDKNKSPAPAKPGQKAPKDIVIKAMVTPFAPGPVISELGSIGLKTGVDKGKVAIKEDAVVVKKGEAISEKVASVLTRLGIEPMEVGLDLKAVYENGVIYDHSILAVDEKEYINSLIAAHRDAFMLSLGITYPTEENISLLISGAVRDARSLSISRELFTGETLKELIVLAERRASALQGLA